MNVCSRFVNYWGSVFHVSLFPTSQTSGGLLGCNFILNTRVFPPCLTGLTEGSISAALVWSGWPAPPKPIATKMHRNTQIAT